MFVSRCGSGLEGLRQQGYTNPVVFRMVQHYDTLFEVRTYDLIPKVLPNVTYCTMSRETQCYV